jgi:hypothetical protein
VANEAAERGCFGEEGGGGEEERRAAVLQREAELLGAQHGAERDGHGAHLLRGQVHDAELGDVGEEEGHPVAGAHPHRLQRVGGARDVGFERAVRPGAALELQRGRVGEEEGGALQVLGDVHTGAGAGDEGSLRR